MTVTKALPKDLIDSLLAGYKKPEDLIGEHGLLKQLTKALVERALQAEMAEHLGHGKNESVTNAHLLAGGQTDTAPSNSGRRFRRDSQQSMSKARN